MCSRSVYETRPGDTPAIIAKEQLGDRDLWADIVVLNAGKCGIMGPHDWYRNGTFLRLPEEAMSAIDHDEIYLQPVCCVNDDIGRLWCEDADPEDCEDGKHWTRYVRADIHESAISELEALRQERDGLRADAVREAFEELQAYMSNKTFGTSTSQKDDFNFFMGGVSQAINVMKNHMRDVLKANQIEGGES